MSKPALGVPPIVRDVLRSPGQPLDARTRAFMEPRLGYDFSHVRLHTDGRAAKSARAVNALAYTVGHDIVFAHGEYAPGTPPGRRLLAHELAHIVQQSGARGFDNRADVPRSTPSASLAPLEIGASEIAERQADTAATVLVNGIGDADFSHQPMGLARQAAPAATTPDEQTAHDSSTVVTTSVPECIPGAGISNATCGAYLANAWWLPLAYVNNATCACTSTPNVPTANCVRKFLQDRLAAKPAWLKTVAASQKALLEVMDPVAYQAFVQSVLTYQIYSDHVDAYRACCCPAGPAAYPDWMAVTAIPIQPCSLVGWFINHFGSCTGTPGSW